MIEEEKKEQKNIALALILILVVLFGFNYFEDKPAKQTVSVPLTPEMTEGVMDMATTDVVSEQAVVVAEEQPDSKSVRISMKNNFVSGSFLANGTQSDDLQLSAYRETTQPDSPAVSLLNNTFKTQLNWQGNLLPDMTKTPVIQGQELTPETPVVMTWKKGGVVVERTVSLDNAYLVNYTDKITNNGSVPVSAELVGQVIRNESSISSKVSSVHEGFLGLFDNKAVEEKYTDITEKDTERVQTQGGWIGQTDKYWQTVFIPEQQADNSMTFEKKGEQYISSFKNQVSIPAGQSITHTTKLFAGAKELKLIKEYEEQGIPRFELSIDFGWYYFLTKPFLYFLGFLYSLVGNMGIAILIFATLLRIAMLPIAQKTYESMAKMKTIQPKIKALQERYKDDRQRLQIEMMNLYKRDKVNPASGCLPMLIQIPVFFALYKVLSVSILMRQAPFYGWIKDLSMPDPSSVFTAFGYLSWPIPSFLNIGVWPLIMGLTMIIQQKLSPQVSTNKDQKVMMMMMPIIFTFMMGNFASGLVIYWTWSNILSIAQQKYIMKKVGV